MDKSKVYIVGVLDGGPESLTPGVLNIVNQAEVLIGTDRLLALFPAVPADKVLLDGKLERTAGVVKDNLGRRKVVLLASGDPNFFGIGRYLANRLGKESIEILPNLTSLQLAFARIKEPWDDASLLSAHSRPLEAIVAEAREGGKMGILTDNVNTPAAVAGALLEAGISDRYDVYVGHNLGAGNEKVFQVGLEGLSRLDVPSPNVVVLIPRGRAESRSQFPVLGIPDDLFQRTRAGLITKMEVRAVSLAKMQLRPADVVWDVGAGSGSVAIEAAGLCRQGAVYAIEKDREAAAFIKRNAVTFGATRLKVIEGEAPEALRALESPNAVFIGGSGGHLREILAVCINRLKPGARLVANVATFENLGTVINILLEAGLGPETTQVNISRSQPIGALTRLEPLNPIFIVTGCKI